MLRIFKSQSGTYLRNRHEVAAKIFLRSRKNSAADEILGGASGLCLYQLAEISGRQIAFVGKVSHRRKSFLFSRCLDVFFQELFEFLHHRVVNLLARDELAVVESQAVV